MKTWQIVFFVFAGQTPLAIAMLAIPLGMALGAGPGEVGIVVIATLVMSLWAVGYGAVAREVTNSGGFYAVTSRGIGRHAGTAMGFVALFTYHAGCAGMCGSVGYYAAHTFGGPWELWALVLVAGTYLVGRRKIDLSSKLLVTAVVLETAILVLLDVTILAKNGISAFSLRVFSPTVMFGGNFGVTVVYAFFVFGGIESVAIYAEEARDPKRSIPRAALLGVLLVGGFTLVNAWSLVAAYGVDNVQAAVSLSPALFAMNANSQFVGLWSTRIMQYLLLFSYVACYLAMHNMANRYIFSLGRDGVLPRFLGRTHRKTQMPVNAGTAQAICTLLLLSPFVIVRADPIMTISTSFYAITMMGTLTMWATSSFAIIRYFWGRRDVGVWPSRVAPASACCILILGVVTAWLYFPDLTGTSVVWINRLPTLLMVAAVGGVVYAEYMRRRRPEVYEVIGQWSLPEQTPDLPERRETACCEFDSELSPAASAGNSSTETRPRESVAVQGADAERGSFSVLIQRD